MTTNIESKTEYYWQWQTQTGRTKEWHSVGAGNTPGYRNLAFNWAATKGESTGGVRLIRVDTQTYQEEAWNVPENGRSQAVRTDLTEDEEAALKDPVTIAAVNASASDPGHRPRRPL